MGLFLDAGSRLAWSNNIRGGLFGAALTMAFRSSRRVSAMLEPFRIGSRRYLGTYDSWLSRRAPFAGPRSLPARP